eukprot:1352550-Amorphochlora_amoeboformis.AAC.1
MSTSQIERKRDREGEIDGERVSEIERAGEREREKEREREREAEREKEQCGNESWRSSDHCLSREVRWRERKRESE